MIKGVLLHDLYEYRVRTVNHSSSKVLLHSVKFMLLL